MPWRRNSSSDKDENIPKPPDDVGGNSNDDENLYDTSQEGNVNEQSLRPDIPAPPTYPGDTTVRTDYYSYGDIDWSYANSQHQESSNARNNPPDDIAFRHDQVPYGLRVSQRAYHYLPPTYSNIRELAGQSFQPLTSEWSDQRIDVSILGSNIPNASREGNNVLASNQSTGIQSALQTPDAETYTAQLDSVRRRPSSSSSQVPSAQDSDVSSGSTPVLDDSKDTDVSDSNLPQKFLDEKGEEWISFGYTTKKQKTRFTLRCNMDNYDTAIYEKDFQTQNCVYPKAMVKEVEYKGNRQAYEMECNKVAWRFVALNPTLAEKRGIIQRAVDSYRNLSEDPMTQSRRTKRLRRSKERGKRNTKRS